MKPKRLWTDRDRASAVQALRSVRGEVSRLCARAPLRSPEMAALDAVMRATSDALLTFGHDVNISLARSAREKLRDE